METDGSLSRELMVFIQQSSPLSLPLLQSQVIGTPVPMETPELLVEEGTDGSLEACLSNRWSAPDKPVLGLLVLIREWAAVLCLKRHCISRAEQSRAELTLRAASTWEVWPPTPSCLLALLTSEEHVQVALGVHFCILNKLLSKQLSGYSGGGAGL